MANRVTADDDDRWVCTLGDPKSRGTLRIEANGRRSGGIG